MKNKKRQRAEAQDDASDKKYFNEHTQAAIVAYQSSDSQKDKERLYTSSIQPAFEKLAENLINIHKFTGMHDSYEDLKSDCINFLFETIRKFDAGRGTNAFSYFNVVAKNWLINKTKQKNAKSKRSVSLDDPQALTSGEQKIIDEFCIASPQDTAMEINESSDDTINVLYQIRAIVKTENELACINSIITIFENMENVDLVNKTAILLYMRELSCLSPKQLTTSMQSIRKYYRKFKVTDDGIF